MSAEWDKIVEELQEEAWADYAKRVIEHAQNPRNSGSMTKADGFTLVTGPCGDPMKIWVRVREEVIQAATFWTDGCGTSIASGSMVTELAKGKTIREAMRITQEDVLDALGGLPEESRHCALLASDTLKGSVEGYLAYRNEPWKRAYRKKPGMGKRESRVVRTRRLCPENRR